MIASIGWLLPPLGGVSPETIRLLIFHLLKSSRKRVRVLYSYVARRKVNESGHKKAAPEKSGTARVEKVNDYAIIPRRNEIYFSPVQKQPAIPIEKPNSQQYQKYVLQIGVELIFQE